MLKVTESLFEPNGVLLSYIYWDQTGLHKGVRHGRFTGVYQLYIRLRTSQPCKWYCLWSSFSAYSLHALTRAILI